MEEVLKRSNARTAPAIALASIVMSMLCISPTRCRGGTWPDQTASALLHMLLSLLRCTHVAGYPTAMSVRRRLHVQWLHCSKIVLDPLLSWLWRR